MKKEQEQQHAARGLPRRREDPESDQEADDEHEDGHEHVAPQVRRRPAG